MGGPGRQLVLVWKLAQVYAANENAYGNKWFPVDGWVLACPRMSVRLAMCFLTSIVTLGINLPWVYGLIVPDTE